MIDIKGSFYDLEFNETELTVWVDPLDGSKGFSQGFTNHLTCIIGIGVRNRPRIGIMHKPFSSLPYAGCERTYIGIPEAGLFHINTLVDSFGEKITSEPEYMPPFGDGEFDFIEEYYPKVCSSFNPNQTQMDAIIDSLLPSEVLKAAGSGNKFIHMVEGLADYYINFVPGFKYWDMCASEALLKSRFGLVTDACRNPLFYIPKTNNFTIDKGIIASNNPSVFEINQRRIEVS